MDIKENKIRKRIIPLGQNCMPRVILTRWKVKPSKIFGELTYPFDLAVFSMPEITKTLHTNFNEFFYQLEYINNCWVKTPSCIEFCHDKRFKEKDKHKLINLYLKRIENFRNAIINDNFILFVQILGDFEDIERLFIELKRLRAGKSFALAVIDTENIVTDKHIDNLYILKIPFPSEEYKNNWWKKKYYNSKTGKIFEKTIADFCAEIIKKY